MTDNSRKYSKQNPSINTSEMQTDHDTLMTPCDASFMRKRSSAVVEDAKSPRQIKKNQDILRIMELKEQLLAIRQRKAFLPRVPDPQIVKQFAIMKEQKEKKLLKKQLKERNQQLKKQITKIKHLNAKSQLQFEEKIQIFKEKSALLKVLGTKMQTELTKTKQRYRQVQFNRIIVTGVKKILYYRLVEILFNDETRKMFNSINYPNLNESKNDEDSMGTCLGYLTLFVCLVGVISGARVWLNFTFRGPRSSIKANDGAMLMLHSRQGRLLQAVNLIREQLCQIMRDTMNLNVPESNFYELCNQLTKQILTIR